jgi:hypothetical protein
VCVSMERHFFTEAKSFCLAVKDGYPDFHLEEKKKGFVGAIFVSHPTSSWLVDSLEAACLSPVKEDFVKTFREDGKALMVHGGGNKARRFLQAGIYVEGGQKGVIWIPEGRNGRGWRRFVEELRLLLLTKEKGLDSEASKSNPSAGLLSGRLFANVIRAASGVEVKINPNPPSSCPLDVLPCFGKGSGGVETRMAVDCYELEMPVSLIPLRLPKKKKKCDSLEAATAGMRRKKMKGFFVNCWQKKFLGFSHVDLVQFLNGLREGLLEGGLVKPTS